MINNNSNNISSSIQIGRNDDMQLSLNNDNRSWAVYGTEYMSRAIQG